MRRWSAATAAGHWLSALAVLALLAIGWTMVHSAVAPGLRFDLYQWHKSLGLLALALLPARLLARLATRDPPPVAGPAWERRAAAAMQAALLALTLISAVSGWLLASAAIVPVPTRFFGFFVVPDLVSSDAALAATMGRLHAVAAWTLAGAVALHGAAAVKHHFWDGEDTLRALWPWRPLKPPRSAGRRA